MTPLYKVRTIVDGREVDFIFLEDVEFRNLLLDGHKGFIADHQEGEVPVALIGYPSLNSIVCEQINFSVEQLRDVYPGNLQNTGS